MGNIKEFELFHGAVLTALVRRDNPLTLSMIETKPRESWSTYRVNEAINLLVKHSAAPSSQKNAVAWSFTFSPAQMEQLCEGPAWAALVCGSKALDDDMELCLLDPEQLALLLDVASNQQQGMSVKDPGSGQLKVSSRRHMKGISVPRSRIRTWEVPGS